MATRDAPPTNPSRAPGTKTLRKNAIEQSPFATAIVFRQQVEPSALRFKMKG